MILFICVFALSINKLQLRDVFANEINYKCYFYLIQSVNCSVSFKLLLCFRNILALTREPLYLKLIDIMQIINLFLLNLSICFRQNYKLLCHDEYFQHPVYEFTKIWGTITLACLNYLTIALFCSASWVSLNKIRQFIQNYMYLSIMTNNVQFVVRFVYFVTFWCFGEIKLISMSKLQMYPSSLNKWAFSFIN